MHRATEPIVVHRLWSPAATPPLDLPANSIGAGDNKPPAKMKGLFKSKPKTPVELVRQTRDLLMYAQRNSDTRESKREEKVRIQCLLVSSILDLDYFPFNLSQLLPYFSLDT